MIYFIVMNIMVDFTVDDEIVISLGIVDGLTLISLAQSSQLCKTVDVQIAKIGILKSTFGVVVELVILSWMDMDNQNN